MNRILKFTELHDESVVPTIVPAASTDFIHVSVREDQIATVSFDRPGSAANIFDLQTLSELDAALNFIERRNGLKGVVFSSTKPAIFIAGADLNLMREDTPLDEVAKLIERGQSVINRIAALPMPTVAAIHGAAVGGGYELCLACDYRIATGDRATKLGLPETKIGLLPAWGGSTRLPRLIGLPKALDIILGGKTVPAKVALKLGMIDELAPVEHLVEAAVKKIGHGKPSRHNHWLTNNSMTATIIGRRVHKELLKKTRGNYPALLMALEVVTHGIMRSQRKSLALEREGFLDIVKTDACHNLLRLFFLQERARKRTLPTIVPRTEPKPITNTAVIGAGVMGIGIAHWLSSHQRWVILRDISVEQIAHGMAGISKLYRDGLKRHLFTPLEVQAGLDRIHPTATEVDLPQADLVIEAATENLELKTKLFQHLGEITSEHAILATNTSALPISDIAAGTRIPERVVGLHFFNPVHRMQLVEIIAARQTSPQVLQRTVKFAQQIGKLPVVVKDSPGFVVNRILMPYLVEAVRLFNSGARVEDLDEVMLDFGMPMGPMRLLDEVGFDVALHVASTLAAHFPAYMQIPDCLQKMAKDHLLGRKSGRGFYIYEHAAEPKINPDLGRYVSSPAARTLPLLELQERMVFLMANEAARCLEEQVVSDPADIDFAMVMGTGFAPFRGGPLRYIDAIGAARLVGAMDHLVAHGAAQFTPCALLTEIARSEKRFYPKPTRPYA